MDDVPIISSTGHVVGTLHLPEHVAFATIPDDPEHAVYVDAAVQSGFPITWNIPRAAGPSPALVVPTTQATRALQIPPSSTIGGILLQALDSMIQPILRRGCPARLPARFVLQCKTDAHGTLTAVFGFAERDGALVARGGFLVPWKNAKTVASIRSYLERKVPVLVTTVDSFVHGPKPPGADVFFEVLKQQEPKVPGLPARIVAVDPITTIMSKIRLPK